MSNKKQLNNLRRQEANALDIYMAIKSMREDLERDLNAVPTPAPKQDPYVRNRRMKILSKVNKNG